MADLLMAAEWRQLFASRDPRIIAQLSRVYGDDAGDLEVQVSRYHRVVGTFCQLFEPDCRIALVRAPGRVNLVGMHVDHRGGHVNPIASGDVIMAVERRDDDWVVLHNLEDRFEASSFAIGEELPPQPIREIVAWERWTRERATANRAGHWSNYVKAPLVYLQNQLSDRRLFGMNAVVSGNVPQAAGMASSSAVVVGAAEACAYLNGLDFQPREFVELCGIAEWYVGTRGGAGDHSAIKLSRRGHMAHVSFFPLEVELVPFPEEYRVVISNTGVTAHKAAGARDVFNQRVAAYEIGMLLIKERLPELAPRLQHLRDLDADHLGVDDAAIYEVLLALPEQISRAELARALPGQAERLQQLYGTHADPPDGYMVRAVCLFGVAECQRGRLAAERLRTGDVVGFGELMNLSHDGDRLTCVVSGQRVPRRSLVGDAMLQGLVADQRSGDAARVRRSALSRQPGGYAVSCVEGDELVDTALAVEGVLGARLVGAGLGGVVATLVHREHVAELVDAVARYYFGPRGLSPAVQVCTPLEGSGVLDVP